MPVWRHHERIRLTRTPGYHTVTALLVAGCLVAIVNFAIRSTFDFFTLPISEAHGWPREIFSFAMAELARVPTRWNHLVEKNSRKINCLSMILSQKWFPLLAFML